MANGSSNGNGHGSVDSAMTVSFPKKWLAFFTVVVGLANAVPEVLRSGYFQPNQEARAQGQAQRLSDEEIGDKRELQLLVAQHAESIKKLSETDAKVAETLHSMSIQLTQTTAALSAIEKALDKK